MRLLNTFKELNRKCGFNWSLRLWYCPAMRSVFMRSASIAACFHSYRKALHVKNVVISSAINIGTVVERIDPSVNHINDMDQLPRHFFSELRCFFEDYKKLENKSVVIEEFGGKAKAMQIVQDSYTLYQQTFDDSVH